MLYFPHMQTDAKLIAGSRTEGFYHTYLSTLCSPLASILFRGALQCHVMCAVHKETSALPSYFIGLPLNGSCVNPGGHNTMHSAQAGSTTDACSQVHRQAHICLCTPASRSRPSAQPRPCPQWRACSLSALGLSMHRLPVRSAPPPGQSMQPLDLAADHAWLACIPDKIMPWASNPFVMECILKVCPISHCTRPHYNSSCQMNCGWYVQTGVWCVDSSSSPSTATDNLFWGSPGSTCISPQWLDQCNS